MTDPLIERLKKLEESQKRGEQVESEIRDQEQKRNQFISEQARVEYDRLQERIIKRVNDANLALRDIPKYQASPGAQTVQQGVFTAYMYFDKPIINDPVNALLVSFGPTSPEAWFLADPPAAERYRLHAVASRSLDKIIWSGDLGDMTTDQLADFILEHLTQYFLENRPA